MVTEGVKLILKTVKDELFPVIGELKDVLIHIQKIRISYQIHSPALRALENKYTRTAAIYFEVVRKLQAPDILFAGMQNNDENMIGYFQYQGAFQKNIDEGISCIEIIDRTLDRKSQNIQNNRTFLLSIVAIITSIMSIL